ncbi:hypothetical protein IC617_07635 [Neiella sp. HB171785]|uniref:Uncharacterized protein n=1 Tax=Neiella litorisoli TaxID=2771431 RepID=A0A8J6QIJ9_9GAMM|nr:hypothetical protein [Neiella litorisoli]MBD1389292.1 hypothetical protein [Neiella litorisoli]
MNELQPLKQQILTLLQEVERLESYQYDKTDAFPLAELKERVQQYCEEQQIIIDTFCELAMISKTTLYKAFNSPGSTKRATIESILSVLGNYQLFVGRKHED